MLATDGINMSYSRSSALPDTIPSFGNTHDVVTAGQAEVTLTVLEVIWREYCVTRQPHQNTTKCYRSPMHLLDARPTSEQRRGSVTLDILVNGKEPGIEYWQFTCLCSVRSFALTKVAGVNRGSSLCRQLLVSVTASCESSARRILYFVH